VARKPRIEFEGGFYHVITRGNQKQKTFREEQDFLKYLRVLGDYKVRYGFSLYAYVLMNNHVHLLITTEKTPLSKVLQGINQRYTMYFNRKYRTVGHLFQGRYRAILCDRDEYLLTLVRYLHYNPVRAKIVRGPEDYPWSSHREYDDPSRAGIVDTTLVLQMFAEDLAQARRLYRKHMEQEASVFNGDLYKTVDQRILGGKEFVARIMKRTQRGLSCGRRRHEFTLEEIASGIGQLRGIGLEELRDKGKEPGRMEGRKLFSLAARQCGYKGTEIADFLRRDPAAVTDYLKDEKSLRNRLERLFLILGEFRKNVNN
jgi:REP element-mobilizing transposase RayT